MADARALVGAAIRSLEDDYSYLDREISSRPEVQAILTAPEDIRRQCILLALRWDGWTVTRLVRQIARKRAGLTLEDIEAILPPPASERAPEDYWQDAWRLELMTGQIEATWKALDDAGRTRLLPQIERVACDATGAVATRLRALTAGARGRVPYGIVDDTSAAGQALRSALGAAAETDEVKAKLIRLLSDYPDSGRAGKKWLAEAALTLAELDQAGETIGALLDAALDAPDYVHVNRDLPYRVPCYITKRDDTFLCGTAVVAGQLAAAAPGLLPRLRRLALRAVAVVKGGYGPASVRLANRCVEAIAVAALPSSVTELLRVERGTRHGALLRQVRSSVDVLAAAQGLTRDELLEMAVEEHGLGPDGTRRVAVGDGWLAVIETDARTARLAYLRPGGQLRKSLPPAVKQASADTLAAVSKDVKAIRATIGNERARLDACLAGGRSWPLARWRDRYLDHPVTGRLTRALIWTFSSPAHCVTGLPAGPETVLTRDGTEVPRPAGDTVTVGLWHPVHADADEVRAWRQLLIGRRLVQPVKQAFREVYVLTPAEETTGDYSNRFAGHVFRQEQARALMKGRSWTAVPMAAWDNGIDHGIARREYPHAAGPPLRAEFYFDTADYEAIADSGLFRYCSSDQVRFVDTRARRPVRLDAVDRLTFSEAMRDVDLFIGVTSIGADPQWLDRGEGRQFGEYWQHFAFGDLGAGAEVRREVLAGLLPMLAIADRCELESRFLVVRGDLRAYRIHLGSGNILMAPDDQYLCIVAARDGRAGQVFLPFDDDVVLSLILSKAFLLADDTKITDPSITRQIRGR